MSAAIVAPEPDYERWVVRLVRIMRHLPGLR